MGTFVETFRGVVYPWHCDIMGHMNVKNYVGMFDEGSYHLLHAAGFVWEAEEDRTAGFADVKHELNYKAEQRAGSLIVIQGAVRRVGTSSAVLYQEMKNAETGVVAATWEATTVYFDLRARKARALPEVLREGLTRLLMPDGD